MQSLWHIKGSENLDIIVIMESDARVHLDFTSVRRKDEITVISVYVLRVTVKLR